MRVRGLVGVRWFRRIGWRGRRVVRGFGWVWRSSLGSFATLFWPWLLYLFVLPLLLAFGC